MSIKYLDLGQTLCAFLRVHCLDVTKESSASFLKLFIVRCRTKETVEGGEHYCARKVMQAFETWQRGRNSPSFSMSSSLIRVRFRCSSVGSVSTLSRYRSRKPTMVGRRSSSRRAFREVDAAARFFVSTRTERFPLFALWVCFLILGPL